MKHHYDLIVIGTERRKGWARWRQRSITESVLRRTKRPTLVIGSEDAAGVGNRLMVPEYRSLLLGAARQRLADVMPSSAASDVRLHVAGGPIAQTIRAHAADLEADLIVMGRSKRFMHLGSTAVRVLRTTDRALLIVPPSASAQTIGVGPSVHTLAA